MNKTPYEVAADIARQLQNDPIAAAQVKEHLGEKWLLELLEIQPPVLPEDDAYGEEGEENPDMSMPRKFIITVVLCLLAVGAMGFYIGYNGH